jgi:hypothetical protein
VEQFHFPSFVRKPGRLRTVRGHWQMRREGSFATVVEAISLERPRSAGTVDWTCLTKGRERCPRTPVCVMSGR